MPTGLAGPGRISLLGAEEVWPSRSGVAGITDINDILADLECDGLLFADDTCLTAVGKDPNLTTAALNRDLEKFSVWANIKVENNF